MAHKIGVISLGCNKNRVDTEHFLWELEQAGNELTPEPDEADIIIINTCGFIDAAKLESIEAVIEAAGHKKSGKVKKVLVTGCLPERYREELAQELVEADGFIGVNQYARINEVVDRVMDGERVLLFDKGINPINDRILTTPKHLAYVRIAEGCDNHCSYCVIPGIRGKFRSRSIESIHEECVRLVDGGVKEIVLVAQDTTYYGNDIYGENSLPRLLRSLAQTDAEWIRVLYCYPERVNMELLDVMAGHDNILNYLDIPLQHIDDDILKSMGRPCTEKSVRFLLRNIQGTADFTIRTTFIAGYPGETQAQHEKLLEFVGEGHFDRMGAFAYSREENTRAAKMEGQLDEQEKIDRQEALMRVQRGISFRKNRSKIGNVYDILVEGYDEKEDVYYGRSKADAPVTDGMVYMNGCDDASVGSFRRCKIAFATEYDLLGECIDDAGK